MQTIIFSFTSKDDAANTELGAFTYSSPPAPANRYLLEVIQPRIVRLLVVHTRIVEGPQKVGMLCVTVETQSLNQFLGSLRSWRLPC